MVGFNNVSITNYTYVLDNVSWWVVSSLQFRVLVKRGKKKWLDQKKEGWSDRVELLRSRYEQGKSIWTGEDLEGEELAEWNEIEVLKQAWQERELATHSA